MVTIVKLQKIGNSIKATIPKEIADDLALRAGEDVVVAKVDETIVTRRRKKAGTGNIPAEFFGKLKAKTGKVQHWPTPKVKSIWD